MLVIGKIVNPTDHHDALRSQIRVVQATAHSAMSTFKLSLRLNTDQTEDNITVVVGSAMFK